MARKRLNKKVLIVGLLFLVILAAGAIVVMLDKIGSAGKFEKYGQQAWDKKDYKEAREWVENQMMYIHNSNKEITI